MTKNRTTTLIASIIAFFICLALMERACSAPVVLKARSGETCGCIVDGDIPTLSQCDAVDYDELHEVIVISHCNQ